jgi:N-terminal acetyltransferase B complex catalytic subunit
MTTIRPFKMTDLLSFNSVNLDPLTETYNIGFYLDYYSRWPEYFTAASSPNNKLMAYSLGKCEGVNEDSPEINESGTKDESKKYGLWHGHVTCLTVSPEFRRLGLGNLLMNELESVSSKIYNCWFVDLFVRKSNWKAIGMYEKFGYVGFRKVLGYYSGEEDAWDMRKKLDRDCGGHSVVPLQRPIQPDEIEWG